MCKRLSGTVTVRDIHGRETGLGRVEMVEDRAKSFGGHHERIKSILD